MGRLRSFNLAILAVFLAGCSAGASQLRSTDSAQITPSVRSVDRPSWIGDSFSESGGWLYFSGACLGCLDYAEAVRLAHAEALKLAVSSVSVVVSSEFTSYVRESFSGDSHQIQGEVSELLSSVSEKIHLQGLNQRKVYFERSGGGFDIWVRLQISKADYDLAKDRAFRALRERYEAEAREKAKRERLSKGAKVYASLLSVDENSALVRVTEVNGVAVSLASAEVIVSKKNRFAKTISFYVMHVPENSSERFTVPLGMVRVCGGSKDVRIPLSGTEKGMGDYLLGADVDFSITLQGVDDVGKEVSVILE